MTDKIADQCAEVAGSTSGEMFYKCTSYFADYTHWSGPFFSALFIGVLGTLLVVAIVSAR